MLNTRIRTLSRNQGAGRSLSMRRTWYAAETPSPGAGTPAQPTGQAPGTPPATGQQPSNPNPEGQDEDEKLDAKTLREQLKKVRQEAAERRVKEREATEKLAKLEQAATAAEETKLKETQQYQKLYEQEKAAREKLAADHATLQLSALKTKVASEAGLPAALADRLKGTTEEDLKADAAELLKTIPKQPPGQRGTTSAFPGGQPVNETEDQKRLRIYGGGRRAFKG